MKKRIGILALLFLVQPKLLAQVPVADVRIACSSEFFKENDEQHALIVRGMWCQDVYFWSIINIGDTIDQLAYYNDSLFTGECVDYNMHEQLIGRYTFDKGYLIRLQEYDTTGVIWRDCNFASGIPHGKHSEYNRKGEIESLLTFNHGVLNGPFIRRYDFYDYGLGECVEKGQYIEGVERLESVPCAVQNDE
jgi:hypothetical protein